MTSGEKSPRYRTFELKSLWPAITTQYYHLLGAPSAATPKKAWKEKNRYNQSWKLSAQTNRRQSKSYYVLLDKKGNHLTPVANFGRNLKGLVPVGNRHLVAGEDIPDISRDYIFCTYHPMFFRKIKNRFRLWSTSSEINTLTSADASGLTIWSANVGTHKIDGATLKPFSMVQAIRSKRKTYLKALPYRWRGFIDFNLTFHPRLK